MIVKKLWLNKNQGLHIGYIYIYIGDARKLVGYSTLGYGDGCES